MTKRIIILLTLMFTASVLNSNSYGQYINNSTNLQNAANFNIDGSGTSSVFNVTKYYEINGNRILSNDGSANLFVGVEAGANNSGQANTFAGYFAGFNNLSANNNSFFGLAAGFSNISGNANTFFGGDSGYSNISGSRNSFFGHSAGYQTNAAQNAFFGTDSGAQNTTGRDNTFLGERAGLFNKTGEYNTFVGGSTGFSNTKGEHLSLLGYGANSSEGLSYATAIGSGTFVNKSNKVQIGRIGNDVVGIGRLGAGGSIQLCLNRANVISSCSSSKRYKTNISNFGLGLDLIKKLQPVSFKWKGDDGFDLGLVAEDVGKIEQRLVVKNDKGQIEGVKYDRISVVLINAMNQQQEQIDKQKKKIENQNKEIKLLKKIICSKEEFAKACN